MIGASNRFAHAAAVAVAEAPAKAYNPLFIYGESGLGKTHLLHAIGHYARSLYPDTRVRYVSSEEFTNEFINSIRDGKGDAFRKRYREMDKPADHRSPAARVGDPHRDPVQEGHPRAAERAPEVLKFVASRISPNVSEMEAPRSG